MHTHEYKLESKRNMMNLYIMNFLTHEHDISFHFWYFDVGNDTGSNQVIYYFVNGSIDTQYC